MVLHEAVVVAVRPRTGLQGALVAVPLLGTVVAQIMAALARLVRVMMAVIGLAQAGAVLAVAALER